MRTTKTGCRHPVLQLAVVTTMVAALLVAVPAAAATGPQCLVDADGILAGHDYTSLQAAVDDPSCAIITLDADTFAERVLIQRDVTIIGAGQTETVIDGGGLGTVIWKAIGSVTIEHLTITGGAGGFRAPGGIYNGWGLMTIRDVTVTGNTSPSAGGGVYGYGPLTLERATITDNSANHGGGVAVFYYNTADVTDSVIANNVADTGGGIASGVVTLVNSTVSHNASRGWAGGIYVNRYLAATHSTIAHNTAAVGGAMFVYSGRSADVQGSILAGNGPQECYGTVVSGGYNVLASTAGCGYVPHPTDLVADPLLDLLADNGGPTQTHALLSGSPAIDLIPPGDCPVNADQRGVTRPFGTGCDAGAFELEYNQPPVADAGEDQLLEATSPSGAEVTLNGSGSSDPDDDPIIYTWTENSTEIATGVNPPVTLGLGIHTIVLTVTDPYGATDSDEVVVMVEDTTPPYLAVTVSPDTLWPPNHQYVEVTTTIEVADIADSAPEVTLQSVTSNEPDDGLGDGDVPDDIVVVNNASVLLRAERSGLGEGRVYTLTYEAQDASGNITEASAIVVVPKSMKKK